MIIHVKEVTVGMSLSVLSLTFIERALCNIHVRFMNNCLPLNVAHTRRETCKMQKLTIETLPLLINYKKTVLVFA